MSLWHRLPWAALFWALIVGLFGMAAILAVIVEVRDARLRYADGEANLKDGDTVRVVVVLNGDEVVVEKGKGRATVRMVGIHAFDPVVNEFEITAFGRASVSFLDQWVLDKDVVVHLDITPRDVRGRYLAYLERDGIDINHRMVEEGLAVVYTEYAFAREGPYLTSELIARKSGRGLWGGKRSKTRIRALRKDWDTNRHERDGVGSADPLLGERP